MRYWLILVHVSACMCMWMRAERTGSNRCGCAQLFQVDDERKRSGERHTSAATDESDRAKVR
jgi:hypothetical protein